MTGRKYWRERWPDEEVPPGEPLWSLYEVDESADSVLRTVDVFPDGRITRNSIELEQRKGDVCPSLIDVSVEEGFQGASGEEITAEEFERHYQIGEDKPFWFPDGYTRQFR